MTYFAILIGMTGATSIILYTSYDFYSYSTGSNENLVCNKISAPWSSIFCSQCSQLNRNKNHVINLLLHEELSWRLLTKLPESISTFQLPQKMWSQASVPWGCTKMCLEQEIVPVALFRCLKIRSLTFAFIFDHENMTLESFCTSKAPIRI